MARRQQPGRQLDLLLLTIGANDALFSGVVADVITESATERALFRRGGLISTIPEAQRALDTALPAGFARLRATLKTFMGDLARVVFVSYRAIPPCIPTASSAPADGSASTCIRPSASTPNACAQAAEFVSATVPAADQGAGGLPGRRHLPRPGYREHDLRRFPSSGIRLARLLRACRRATRYSTASASAKAVRRFERDPVAAATDPMACPHRASDYRPYSPRARWIRTANDSYFTAMTFPEGLPSLLQPLDIHDATWAATSAVYGGAIHPTAEGHAAMADAALPAMREILALPEPKRPVGAEPRFFFNFR